MKLREFESLIDEESWDDIGMSGSVYKTASLVKGKIYIQADQTYYDAAGKNSKPFIVDDTGCSRDIAQMLKNRNIKEIINFMVFAIDFDGTCVTHKYPDIGEDIGAVPVLQALVAKGHELILNTMRSGDNLQEAVQWFNNNNLPLYGINKHPTQREWSASSKTYADMYIDDAALGCPLKRTLNGVSQSRPFIDWEEVEKYLKHYNYI